MPLLSKNQLKNLLSYKQSKVCDADSCFVVEGDKLCLEALTSGFTIRVVCAVSEWLQQHAASLRAVDEVYQVSDEQLSRLSSLKTPNQVWMLLQRRPYSAAAETAPLTLVLDRLQDPGNMGTILRTADWYGIRQIVCSLDTVSCYNPKVVQATMGAIFRTQVTYTDLVPYLDTARSQGLPVYGAVLGGTNLYQSTLQHPALLVIGNESRGISDAVAAHLTHTLTIPNLGGTAESLNASVAAAILISEFFRV